MKFMSPFLPNYRYFNRRINVTLLLVLISGLIVAQPALSLNDAISTGLSNNYGIRISRNQATIDGRNVTPGNAGMLPSLSLYASWDKSLLNAKAETALGGDLEKDNAPVNVLTGGVQVLWTLFDGTGMYIERNKLKGLATMSNLELRITMENGVYDITSAYCDIIRQNQLLDACRKKLEISNIRVHLAKVRLQSGSGSEQDLLQSEVIRQADTTALTKQLALVKNAKIRLNRILAEDLEKEYLTEDSIVLVELPSLEQLIKNATLNNGLYLLQEENSNITNLEMKSLRSKQYPRLILRGAYGYYENETDASFISYNRTLGPQFGISASMNLYDGMNLNRKISNARIQTESEKIRSKDQEQRIIAAVMNAWYDHQSLLQQVILGKEGLKMAEKNLAIASEAYSSGLISSIQLREAQDDLFNASSDLYDALYSARISETELLRLSGNLVK